MIDDSFRDWRWGEGGGGGGGGGGGAKAPWAPPPAAYGISMHGLHLTEFSVYTLCNCSYAEHHLILCVRMCLCKESVSILSISKVLG